MSTDHYLEIMDTVKESMPSCSSRLISAPCSSTTASRSASFCWRLLVSWASCSFLAAAAARLVLLYQAQLERKER